MSKGVIEGFFNQDNQETRNGLPTIMVIDDSPLALRSVKAMLSEEYKVLVATSGEQGVLTAREKQPDLILLDYEMPGWDGKKTLEFIRKDIRLKDTPVVFLTGVADKEHVAAVLELEPAGYLLKPLEKEKIMDILGKILKKK